MKLGVPSFTSYGISLGLGVLGLGTWIAAAIWPEMAQAFLPDRIVTIIVGAWLLTGAILAHPVAVRGLMRGWKNFKAGFRAGRDEWEHLS